MDILQLDAALTSLIFSLPHPAILTFFFSFWSFQGPFLFIWIALFGYIISIFARRFDKLLIPSLSSIILSSFLVNIILKKIFLRPRPLTINHQQLTISNYPSDFSFPSGHATFAFSVAYILSHLDPARRPLYYGAAFLVAFSRVYLGYHYVGDVVVGAAIGWTISYVIIGLLPNLVK